LTEVVVSVIIQYITISFDERRGKSQLLLRRY